MQLDKADVLKYLSDMRAHFAAYHNHKEVSAWAGVLLYVIFATQIAFAPTELFKTNAAVFSAYLLVVTLWLVVLLYLGAQLTSRVEAANYVAALLLLSTEYLTKDQHDIKIEGWSPRPKPDACYQSEVVLPAIVYAKADEMKKVGQRTLWLLALAPIALVTLSFFAAASRLWFR